MPGTRTAPDVEVASPNRNILVVKSIDTFGDIRTDSYDIDADFTEAEVQAFTVALQAGMSASIFEVRTSFVWASQPNKSSAVTGLRASNDDLIRVLLKNGSGTVATNLFIRSPITDLFINANSEEVDVTDAVLVAAIDAFKEFRGSFIEISAGFTERSEFNKATRF